MFGVVNTPIPTLQRIIRQLIKKPLSASAVCLRYEHVLSHDPMLQQCPHRRVSVTFRLLILRAVDLLHSENSAVVGARRRIISIAPTVGEYVTMAWRANNDYKLVTEISVVKSRPNSCVGRCECRNWGPCAR